MCMISIQGMNCSRDNCCHRNLNFCICQVWIYNSAIIRLQGRGRSYPSDPSLWRNPFLHTSLPSSMLLPPAGLYICVGDAGDSGLFFLPGWLFRGCCDLLKFPGEPIGAFRQVYLGLPCSTSSWTQAFNNTYLFYFIFGYSKCVFPKLLTDTDIQSIIFYDVKSQYVSCMITSSEPNHNQEPCYRGTNKLICSLSINTYNFLEENTAQKLFSSGPSS